MAIPTNRPKLRNTFKNARTISPLYTGGPVAITQDGLKMVTCVSDELILTDTTSGSEICRFLGDTQPISSLCITPSSTHLMVFTSSLSLRIYEIPGASCSSKTRLPPIRTIARAHDAPVHICRSDPTSTYLASGSADGVVKVWSIVNGYVTHVFKGHGGVVSALVFSFLQNASVTEQNVMRLFTASVDTRIRVFNLTASASDSRGGSKPEAVLEGHVSVPRGLDVSANGKYLVSGGRDSVVLVWDLSLKDISKTKGGKHIGDKRHFKPTLSRTIPTLERVEALGLLDAEKDSSVSPSSDLQFYTGGEKGVVKIWDGKEGKVLFTLNQEYDDSSSDQEEQKQVVDAIYLPSLSTIISVHADQNILFHSLATRSLTKQFIGYNDEIVDATFLSLESAEAQKASFSDSHLALATNSSLIRVYSIHSLDARLLRGHSDIVLSLDRSAIGDMLVSGSKDRSARIWVPLISTPESSNWGYACVGICEGHAESVGAIALSRKPTEEGSPANKFMFTGSQDRTIKMWDLSGLPSLCNSDGTEVIHCKSLTTLKAHDKDINSLDVAPNDRFLASGSQDRTANIYEIVYSPGTDKNAARGELKLIGTCKGHKRGVWTVRFGRTERVLATGSGDKTIKLWNLDDFTCLKTFEGHTNSVLRVDFLNMGTQLVSSASDGLVKIWNVKDEECVTTLDNHEDKIWALAVSTDERTIVSGAADSVVTFWEDCTEEQEAEKETKRAEKVLKDQDFANYVSLRDYKRAIQLALIMGQPGRLMSLFKDIIASKTENQSDTSIIGSSVDEVIRTLSGSDLAKLLRFVKQWNTNAKTSAVAQVVLFAILKMRSAEDVIQAFGDESREAVFAGDGDNSEEPSVAGGAGLKDLVDALIPYTERHLSRMERLVQESYVVDYILGEMDDGMFGNDEMEVDAAS